MIAPLGLPQKLEYELGRDFIPAGAAGQRATGGGGQPQKVHRLPFRIGGRPESPPRQIQLRIGRAGFVPPSGGRSCSAADQDRNHPIPYKGAGPTTDLMAGNVDMFFPMVWVHRHSTSRVGASRR